MRWVHGNLEKALCDSEGIGESKCWGKAQMSAWIKLVTWEITNIIMSVTWHVDNRAKKYISAERWFTGPGFLLTEIICNHVKHISTNPLLGLLETIT